MTPDRWTRITELFEGALARDPADRLAFVRDAASGEEEVYTEVLRLLANHASADDFLERPPVPHVISPSNRSVHAFAFFAGQVVGSRFRIVKSVGHGGMGEVYEALDLELKESVALKTLRQDIARDPTFIERFKREVQRSRSISHPNICRVYDLFSHGVNDGAVWFLTMELLRGETLAERIQREQRLETAAALPIMKQICDALDAAHRSGLIHRDLKSGNVMLVPQSVAPYVRAVVTDFGLALPMGHAGAKTSTLDHLGKTIGTPAYMAPEQLSHQSATPASDVYALGVVMYETLTGVTPYVADSPLALAVQVLTQDPATPHAHVPDLDWRWERIIMRCLEREPSRRFESAGAIFTALDGLISDGTLEGPDGQTAPAQHSGTAPRVRRAFPGLSRWIRAAAIIAVCLLCTGLGVLVRAWWSSSAGQSLLVVRFTLPIEPVPTIDFGPYFGSRLALSRDGRRLAYVSKRADKAKTPIVFVRQLASPSTTLVEGTEGATGVFFSPDGAQLGFFAGGKMKRTSLDGGSVLTLCDAPHPAGAVWGDDDTIIFAPSPTSVLMRVSSRGGTSTPVTAFRSGEKSHRFPQFLPGGKAIVYAVAARADDFTSARIVAESLQTGSRTELFEGTYPRYVGSGHLVFARENSLLAAPFDPVGLRPLGTPISLINNLRMSPESGAGLYDVSETALVYRLAGTPVIPRLLVWVDMSGREEAVPLEPAPSLQQPRISPDGTRVAVTVGEPPWNQDLWIYDFLRKVFTPFIVENGEQETPVWSPDSRRIAFSASGTGQQRMIHVLGADGAGHRMSLGSGQHIHVSDWSPDGRDLLWTEFKPTPGGEIRDSALDGSGLMRTVAAGSFNARGAVFSPDGRWIAFTSNESGRDEIYVLSYRLLEPKRRISVGREPVWSRRGDRLCFRGQDRMSCVAVQTSPTFSVGTPRVLFPDPYEPEENGGDRNYDLSPDGRRFLMVKPAHKYPAAEVIVTLNWQAGLGDRQ